MHGIPFVMFFFFVLLPVALVVGVVALVVRMFRSSSARAGEKTADEARMIQEMYQGLGRLEERVEALETILLDERTAERQEDGARTARREG
ncbi:MAG: envelope stress response membrane protein PspB [Desulfovibrionaceae bacterium]|jgi:phage shock protein B|nr:envelope stress response membrane protein PspB [Desulfovibrionaceae bacterium]